MGALSKLAKKCRECPFVSKRDNKKMEMYGYLEIPPKIEIGSAEMFNPEILEPTKEEKEKFILQQIESSINVTQAEKEKYFASISAEMTNGIKTKKERRMNQNGKRCYKKSK